MHLSHSRIWKSASQCYLKCLWTARLSIDWFVQLGTVFVSPTFVERFFKMKSFWRGCGCHQRGWTTPWIRYQPPPTVLRVTYARPTPTLHCCEFSIWEIPNFTSAFSPLCIRVGDWYWCVAWSINKSPAPIYCPKTLGSPFLSILERAH